MNTYQIATQSRLGKTQTKLLEVTGSRHQHLVLDELLDLLDENTVLVANTAATLPASFHGELRGQCVELRLVRNIIPSQTNIRQWIALLFHRGNWHQRTEDRQNPDFAEEGDTIHIGEMQISIQAILHHSKRLIAIKFEGSMQEIWNAFYRYGRPIQYSHLDEELNLWDVQTIFSSLPVAVEPSSASFQLNWSVLNDLGQQGIDILYLSHAISISSTGLEELDRLLPLPEYYWIGDEMARHLNQAKEENKEIIAIGTSVTRALEDNFAKFGRIRAGQFEADNIVTADYPRQFVSGLLTGMHLPDESHMQLLHNFVDKQRLERIYREARTRGYLWHEYGDLTLFHHL